MTVVPHLVEQEGQGAVWFDADQLGLLYEAPDNPRRLSDEARERLRYSLKNAPRMLKLRPIIATPEGEVVAGNMRLRVAKEEGVGTWVGVENLTPAERREWMVRDNQGYGEWVPEELAALVAAHAADDGDMALLGFADEEVMDLLNMANEGDGTGEIADQPESSSLADRFIVPPFTVLDTRRGDWRDRKRAWMQLLPDSVRGRADLTTTAFRAQSSGDPRFYEQKQAVEAALGHPLSHADFLADHYRDTRDDADSNLDPGNVSVFDPMLAELAYRWYSRDGDQVLDPFAGGSVRGLVAAALARIYTGIDLSGEQVAANREAWTDGARDGWTEPRWLVGDARDTDALAGGLGPFDLLFSCPPYYDLEVYGDDPADLSRAATYDDFRDGYWKAIAAAAAQLRDDRFAVWVIGDVRDKKSGLLRPLLADTISAFNAAGLDLYNQATVVVPVGSVRILAAKQFVASRKLGRTHQYVLTFVKGDGKAATARLGDVDVEAIAAAADDTE